MQVKVAFVPYLTYSILRAVISAVGRSMYVEPTGKEGSSDIGQRVGELTHATCESSVTSSGQIQLASGLAEFGAQ